MKSAERTAAWRRERRGLLRVPRAWRLDQAGRERSRAIARELLRQNEDQ